MTSKYREEIAEEVDVDPVRIHGETFQRRAEECRRSSVGFENAKVKHEEQFESFRVLSKFPQDQRLLQSCARHAFTHIPLPLLKVNRRLGFSHVLFDLFHLAHLLDLRLAEMLPFFLANL